MSKPSSARARTASSCAQPFSTRSQTTSRRWSGCSAASTAIVSDREKGETPTSVYDIIVNVVDGDMTAQRAIEAPRFLIGCHPAEPAVSRVQIEDRIHDRFRI